VPIFYESRLPELRIVGNTLDALFDPACSADRSEKSARPSEEYATRRLSRGPPKRVEAICLDLVTHFTSSSGPTVSRRRGDLLARDRGPVKETLDRLNAPQSAIVIPVEQGRRSLVKHHTSEEQRKDIIERFLKPGDPLSTSWCATCC